MYERPRMKVEGSRATLISYIASVLFKRGNVTCVYLSDFS